MAYSHQTKRWDLIPCRCGTAILEEITPIKSCRQNAPQRKRATSFPLIYTLYIIVYLYMCSHNYIWHYRALCLLGRACTCKVNNFTISHHGFLAETKSQQISTVVHTWRYSSMSGSCDSVACLRWWWFSQDISVTLTRI